MDVEAHAGQQHTTANQASRWRISSKLALSLFIVGINGLRR
jgi:hypothetical protein